MSRLADLLCVVLFWALTAHAEYKPVFCPVWKSGIGITGDPASSAQIGFADAFKNAPQCQPANAGNCSLTSPPSTVSYTCSGHVACNAFTYSPVSEGTAYDPLIGFIHLVINEQNSTHCGYVVNSGRPDPHKNNGASDCDTCKANPVNTATGNKFERATDYRSPYDGGVSFERHYNTGRTGLQSSVGANWTHTWSRKIEQFAGAYAFAVRPDGNRRGFLPIAGGGWAGEADTPDRLSGTAAGWTLTTRDNEVETYDSAGRLLSITDSASRVTTLAYSDGTAATATVDGSSEPLVEGLPIRVTDHRGRSLRLFYTRHGYISRFLDPAGLGYAYNVDVATGNLLSVTYPDGYARHYVYNEPDNTSGASLPRHLTGIVDENGTRFATYQYDAAGQAVTSMHAGGADRHFFSFDTNGGTGFTDPLGATRTTTFDVTLGVARLASTIQPCPECGGTATRTLTYDANGNRTSERDFNGNLACYSFDVTRNLETERTEGLSGAGSCASRVTTSATRTITTEWHATWRLKKRVAEPLRITTFAYHGDPGVQCAPAGAATTLLCSKSIQATTDASGLAAFAAAADGAPRIWSYACDAIGQVLTIDGPRTDLSDVTTNAYYTLDDPSGNHRAGDLASTTNALGHTTLFTSYDPAGRLKRMVDPNGLETLLDYSPRGWLIMRALGSTATGFETTTYAYDAVGQLVKVTLPDVSSITYSYDDAHRLTDIRDGLGNRIHYALDAMGNRVEEQAFDISNTLVRKHGRAFDALNRLARDIGGTNPATQVTTNGYDANGNLVSILDPLERATTQAYDARNRVLQVVDPFNGPASPTRYAYNGQDQLTSVTDPQGLSTTYTLNGFGELLAQSSPDTGVTGFTYDSASNLKTKLDARGVEATYVYDELNRITRITYPDEAVTYAYDACASGVGRLCAITDSTGTTSFAYDLWGRVISKSQALGPLLQSVAYAYNAAGQLTQVTMPSGRKVTYTYSNNRPVSVAVDGQTVLDGVFYEPFGPNGGWRWGNSTAGSANFHTRIYDRDFRATRITSDRPANGVQPYFDRQLSWDALGRVQSLTDLSNAALSATYGYDALDRLTSASQAGTSMSFGYLYSGVGDRLTSTVNGAASAYAYAPGSHRLSQVSGAQTRSFTVDPAGNVTGDGTKTWTFGGNGRNKQFTSGAFTTRYGVNALGQRVSKTDGTGKRTTFAYDEAGRLLGEYDNTGQPLAETVWLEDLPVAVVR